jgi:histidyl-tRNA synthetase
MFRYDRPQAGRYRQHTQFGVEVFGAAGPEADLEVMLLAITFLRELGLGSLAVHLNSIGCPACRPAYREALVAHYRERHDQLCQDCQRRLERNPLRLLDCKEEQCQPHKLTAPSSVDHLCPDCAAHFSQLQSLLRRFAISYEIDPTLVRGLDYYTRTIFEIMYSGLGAQGTVCGGGRYDGLIEAVGGPALPGVGYGMGLERVLLTLEKENRPLPPARGIEIFLAVAGSPTDSDLGGRVQELLYGLRWAGVAAEADAMGRSLRQQLRYADRSGAKLVAVIGQDEVSSGTVKIKEMATGREVSAGLADLAATVKAMLATG